MIISPEVFYNVAAILHIAMLVLVIVFIVGQVVIFVAKYRAVRSLKQRFERDIEGVEEMLESLPDMLKEMHTHGKERSHTSCRSEAKESCSKEGGEESYQEE